MRTHFLFALALLLTACDVKTEPNSKDASASGGSGGRSGDGGSDAGDAGGEGGTGGVSGNDGGQSGEGGDSAAPDCTDNDACNAMRPQCDERGECVSCSSNAACDERDPLSHCDTTLGSETRGQCIACLEDAHCEGSDDGEYCLRGECVPCKADADCTELDKPECGAGGQCTGCTSDDACDGRDDAEACLTEAGPNRGHCVACVTNDDCSSADAPQCKSDNTCGACTSDAACEDRDGTEHCNLRADAETFGECVECTGATEDDVCGDKSCKQTTGECTDTTQGERDVCQSCEADSECTPGSKCLLQVIGDAEIGHFCFYTFEANDGCADTRPSVRPHTITLAGELSIDSQDTADYCVPRTSCAAIEDATMYMDVPGAAPCVASSECGVGDPEVDGAFCVPADFVVAAARNKCSFGCETSNDCPATGFSTCPTMSPRFCRP